MWILGCFPFNIWQKAEALWLPFQVEGKDHLGSMIGEIWKSPLGWRRPYQPSKKAYISENLLERKPQSVKITGRRYSSLPREDAEPSNCQPSHKSTLSISSYTTWKWPLGWPFLRLPTGVCSSVKARSTLLSHLSQCRVVKLCLSDLLPKGSRHFWEAVLITTAVAIVRYSK